MTLTYIINVQSWNSQHHGQTIHPAVNFILLILFKIPGIVTWSYIIIFTFMAMERVKAKNDIGSAHFGTFNSMFGSTAPYLEFYKKKPQRSWFLAPKKLGIGPGTDYGCPMMKSSSLHGQKSNPNPKFICTAEGYLVCHISPKFQVSLIYAFILCPLSVFVNIFKTICTYVI